MVIGRDIRSVSGVTHEDDSQASHVEQQQPIDTFEPIPSKAPAPVLVVGMGPAGLATAIETARAGKHVLLLDNRMDYTRLQRVQLSYSSAEYLLKLGNEATVASGKPNKRLSNIYEKLTDDGNTIEIKDLQEFLEEAIRHNPELNSLITIKKGDVKPEQVEFSHVVDATGGRGLPGIEATGSEKRVQLAIQPRQEAQGTVTLNTLDHPIDAIKLRSLKQSDMPAFKALGWDRPYLPDGYVLSNSKGTKHYVAGEIPQSILDMKDKDAQRIQMQKWGEAILRARYDIPESFAVTQYGENKNGTRAQAKKKMAVTAFPIRLSYAQEPAQTLASGAVLARVGDASMSANFHLGHGANDAISDAVAFGKALQAKPGFDVIAFNQHQASRRQIVEQTMMREKQHEKYQYELSKKDVIQYKYQLEKAVKKMDDHFRANHLLPVVDQLKSFADDMGVGDIKEQLDNFDANNVDKALTRLLMISSELESQAQEAAEPNWADRWGGLIKSVLGISAHRRQQLRQIHSAIVTLKDQIQAAAQKHAADRAEYDQQQKSLERDIAKYDELLGK